MRDYLNIGPVPWNAPCAQVGSENYDERSRAECKAFINQIRRVLGTEPGSAQLHIKNYFHDFGDYREVVCFYDDQDQEAVEYAFKCEGSELLEDWDEEAKAELART